MKCILKQIESKRFKTELGSKIGSVKISLKTRSAFLNTEITFLKLLFGILVKTEKDFIMVSHSKPTTIL